MGILDTGRSRSTKNEHVFSSRNESSLEKRTLTARATRRPRVDSFLASASDGDKAVFLRTLFNLNRTVRCYATTSERLFVFFDNDVLQDILKREKLDKPRRKARFYALLAFLILVQDYYLLDIFACVSPAVFYEAGNRGARPIKEIYSEVAELLAAVGLSMHAIGFNHQNDLRIRFKKIKKDEQEILRALNEIKATTWSRNFSHSDSRRTRIPFSVAEEECPALKLSYFHPWYVKLLLMHIIEKRMFAANGDQPAARKLMQDPKDGAFDILGTKGGGVQGLGDIELLTYCDLIAQTRRDSPSITMGITFDRGLNKALRRRARILNQFSMTCGVDDPADSTARFIYSINHNHRRTQKANARLDEYNAAFKVFFKEVISHHR